MVPRHYRQVFLVWLPPIGLVIALMLFDLAQATPKPLTCPDATPEAVVRTYYAAATRGDGETARSCFTAAYRADTATAVDPDWQNIKSIQLLAVDEIPLAPVRRPTMDYPPFRSTGFRVKYMAEWRTHMTDRDGLGVRFISLVQVNHDSPWRIDSIGSGP